MINLLHNLDFIFHNDFAFADRFDARQSYFNGEGILYAADYKGFKFAGNVGRQILFLTPAVSNCWTTTNVAPAAVTLNSSYRNTPRLAIFQNSRRNL